MTYLLAIYWLPLVLALLIGAATGYLTFDRSAAGRWPSAWPLWLKLLGVAALVGLAAAAFAWLPKTSGFYLETALLLLAAWFIGCLLGGWLAGLFAVAASTLDAEAKAPALAAGDEWTAGDGSADAVAVNQSVTDESAGDDAPADAPAIEASGHGASASTAATGLFADTLHARAEPAGDVVAATPVAPLAALAGSDTGPEPASTLTPEAAPELPAAAQESAETPETPVAVKPARKRATASAGTTRTPRKKAATADAAGNDDTAAAETTSRRRKPAAAQAPAVEEPSQAATAAAARAGEALAAFDAPQPVPAPEAKSAQPDSEPAAGPSHPGLRPIAAERADGAGDDLQRIVGIGPKNETLLHGLGIFHFRQIAEWTEDNVAWVNSYLSFKGRIEREDWIGQAKQFAAEAPKPSGTRRRSPRK